MSNYIGSKISLFSNSDIRYSGILHDIDSEASTLTLRDVHSFGTEGRLGNPELEIPPGDTKYEYIVFRGAEVKDLVIDDGEEPAPEPPKPAAQDPAVLAREQLQQQQQQLPPQYLNNGRPIYPQQQLPPGYLPQYYPQPMYPPYPLQFDPNLPPPMAPPPAGFVQNRMPVRQPTGPPVQQPIPPAPVQETKPVDVPPAQPPTRTAVVPAVPVPKARQPRQAPPQQPEAPAAKTDGAPAAINTADELAKRLAKTRIAQDPPAAPADPPAIKTTTTTVTATTVVSSTAPARGGWAQRGSRPAARRGGAAGQAPVPSADFDFERSNAKFHKDDTGSEPAEVFYDKSSSFFDNLSSKDVADPAERINRKVERQLNLETFGQASVDTSGGRFRGGRGRGRGRGLYGRRGGFRSQQAAPPAQQQA